MEDKCDNYTEWLCDHCTDCGKCASYQKELRVFTAFSGYDSQCMALDRLCEKYNSFKYELVGWSEIDKYAIKAHNAVFPQWESRNYGDISKIKWDNVPDFDLFTYSSPCQDFSIAGRQQGGEEGSGTRSSLLWECERAIACKRPKYLVFENVPALVSSKFISTFQQWQVRLQGYGYTNFTKILNAKNYGVPQNRERLFMISIFRGDCGYNFPSSMQLKRFLKDVLDTDVDESYYSSDNDLHKLGCVQDVKCETICVNGKVNGNQPSRQDRIYSECGISAAITTSFMPYILANGRVRRLTPNECFKLMGVNWKYRHRIQSAGISNSKIYALAGNSIVVDVLYYIFEKLFINPSSDDGQLTIFDVN